MLHLVDGKNERNRRKAKTTKTNKKSRAYLTKLGILSYRNLTINYKHALYLLIQSVNTATGSLVTRRHLLRQFI